MCGVGSARCAGEPCLAAVFASTHLDGCARPVKSSGGDHPLVALRHVCCSVAGVVVAGAAAMSSLVSALSALVACGCSRVDMGLGRTGVVWFAVVLDRGWRQHVALGSSAGWLVPLVWLGGSGCDSADVGLVALRLGEASSYPPSCPTSC